MTKVELRNAMRQVLDDIHDLELDVADEMSVTADDDVSKWAWLTTAESDLASLTADAEYALRNLT